MALSGEGGGHRERPLNPRTPRAASGSLPGDAPPGLGRPAGKDKALPASGSRLAPEASFMRLYTTELEQLSQLSRIVIGPTRG